jgi:hypothetical protein
MRRFLPVLSCLLFSTPAWGYGERVHSILTREALAAQGFSLPSDISTEDLSVVRSLVDAYGRSHPDAAIQAEWLRRYPTPESFDAWAFKEFLLFGAGSTVNGIDKFDALGGSQLDLLFQAARQPDDDFRNRDRLAYDANRQPLKGPDGKDVPADPALLNMGKLGALSSQAHAHYGLAQVEFSSDAEVLKADPKRFAVAAGYAPGPILTLAAEMNQIHTDLGLIAALSDSPHADSLQWQYTGNGFHYLEDVGNQIHTVQVGLYDFFFDAFLQRTWLSFKTGGGYCGELRTLASIGIDILTNHHTISEMLTEKRLVEAYEGKDSPIGKRLLTAAGAEDPVFAAALDTELAKLGSNPEKEEYGIAITRTLINTSAEEGDDVYRATRGIALSKWRQAGVLYDWTKEDADGAVHPPDAKNQPLYDEFWSLQERAFARASTAVRRMVQLQKKAVGEATDPAAKLELRNRVLDRLIRRQLKMMAEGETRRSSYLSMPVTQASTPERMPAMLAGQVAVPAALAGAWMMLRKRA